MTEPHGEQKEITQEMLDRITKSFEDLVKIADEDNTEFSNKDLTILLLQLSPTLIKLETAVRRVEARVTALENKK